MLAEKQQRTYAEFRDSAKNNGILDPKTTFLLHLGAAMAFGCTP